MNYIYSNAHVSKAELLQAHQYALQYGHEECAKKLDYGLQKIQVNNNDVDTFILCSMKRYTYTW